MAFVVEKVDMTGSEVAYTVKDEVSWIQFSAKGGPINMGTVTAGDLKEIPSGTAQGIESPDLPGKIFFFTGDAAVDLEILYATKVN